MSTTSIDLPMDQAKSAVAVMVLRAFPDCGLTESALCGQITTSSARLGELILPVFTIAKQKKQAPATVAAALSEALNQQIAENHPIVAEVQLAGPYVNFTCTSHFLASIIPCILQDGYLSPRTRPQQPGRDKIMIEFSQPNTHKAFHVGHLRNVSIGDALVRLGRQLGHEVTSVNYFGDEGAHVAKCLWMMCAWMEEHAGGKNQEFIKVQDGVSRGEWLGGMYASAIKELDLASFTAYPFPPTVVAARVLSVSKTLDVSMVELDVGALSPSGQPITVTTDLGAFAAGDVIAFRPIGGNILSAKELGVGPYAKTAFLFPRTLTKLGVDAAEVGRFAPVGGEFRLSLPADKPLHDIIAERTAAVSAILHAMEAGSGNGAACDASKQQRLMDMWQHTKSWSLDEFRDIYKWLGVEFQHEFFESECSAPSQKLVDDYHKRGVFVEAKGGALVADLTAYKLGHCVVRKSDGTGLYATKDLALAAEKFDRFGVDQSIYVVDAAQSHHFKQVFKMLELMGYGDRAKQCVHIAYGQVVLPQGKMSSREGTVVLFSQLRTLLDRHIYDQFLARYEGQWTEEEISTAQHTLAVATMRYGMLNHDVGKNIVFSLDAWASKTGDTGAYALYVYARTRAIARAVESDMAAEVGEVVLLFQGELLTHPSERTVLALLHEFWPVLDRTWQHYNLSTLCTYLHTLGRAFSSWYDVRECSVRHAPSPSARYTRLQLALAVGSVIKHGLNLLGINTLERM